MCVWHYLSQHVKVVNLALWRATTKHMLNRWERENIFVLFLIFVCIHKQGWFPFFVMDLSDLILGWHCPHRTSSKCSLFSNFWKCLWSIGINFLMSLKVISEATWAWPYLCEKILTCYFNLYTCYMSSIFLCFFFFCLFLSPGTNTMHKWLYLIVIHQFLKMFIFLHSFFS